MWRRSMWRRNSERRNSKSVKVIYHGSSDEMDDEMHIRYTRVPTYRYNGRKCPYYDDLYNEMRMILFGKDDCTIPKLYWQDRDDDSEVPFGTDSELRESVHRMKRTHDNSWIIHVHGLVPVHVRQVPAEPPMKTFETVERAVSEPELSAGDLVWRSLEEGSKLAKSMYQLGVAYLWG